MQHLELNSLVPPGRFRIMIENCPLSCCKARNILLASMQMRATMPDTAGTHPRSLVNVHRVHSYAPVEVIKHMELLLKLQPATVHYVTEEGTHQR